MSTIPHPPDAIPERSRALSELLVSEVWAALAIAAMWIAVAVSAVWGPDLVSSSSSGSSTVVPSAVAVAVFASIGTWAVARYGFGRRRS